jgi:hypothetical protein
MTLRTTYTLVSTGVPPTFSAAAASDTMEVGDRIFAVYRNVDSAVKTVTITGKLALENGDTAANKVYAMAAGNVTMQELWIPLYKMYQDPTTGVATITVTAAITGVTLAVVRW